MQDTQHRIDLVVDGVPYLVQVTPYEFNTETRFKVSYNGNPELIFIWDEELKRVAAIGDDAATLPDNLENAIAEKLHMGKYPKSMYTV
jgi:hypothetical protein